MTAQLQKFYRNVYQTNDFRLRILGNKEVFEKTQIGWRQMLVVASQDFFSYFQIFVQDDRCLLFLGIHCKYE